MAEDMRVCEMVREIKENELSELHNKKYQAICTYRECGYPCRLSGKRTRNRVFELCERDCRENGLL